MDRQTDGQRQLQYPCRFFKKKRGDNKYRIMNVRFYLYHMTLKML